MTNDVGLVRDGMVSALSGVDSGRDRMLIAPDQLAWGVNIICRGGFPATRPRYAKRNLTFTHSEMEDWFKTHVMQGAHVYYSNEAFIIASVGGRFFRIDVVGGFEVTEITPTLQTTTNANFNAPAVGSDVAITMVDAHLIFAGYAMLVNSQVYVVVSVLGNVVTATNLTDTPAALVTTGTTVIFLDPNTPNSHTAWMEQAEQYLVIQNGIDGAAIYDGAYTRRAAPDEVPAGTAMVYNEEIGRLCVALRNNEIQIGDVNGGPTGVLKFTETGYLAEGGKFRVPTKYGPITALKMIANLDRSNGQGAMVASGRRGFSTFNLPAARDTWKTVTYPLQINMPIQFGATSQATVVQVNGDLWYRAKDGLRSYLYAMREFISTGGNTPVSNEMDRVLTRDDDRLLYKACSMLFDNRLLFSVSPFTSRNGIAHRAIGVLDFDTTSRMASKAPPAYNGIWVGIRPTAMVTGEFAGQERGFIFSLNPDNENELWEVFRETGDDAANGQTSRIVCAAELKGFSCNQPLGLKEAMALEAWGEDMFGELDITAKYRPDSYPCWFDWGASNHCVTTEDCDTETCRPLQARQPGYATRIPFGQPPDTNETLDKKPARLGYEHQVRLEWQGRVRLRKVLFKARVVQEDPFNVDRPAQECTDTESTCCLPDDLSYVSGLAPGPASLTATVLGSDITLTWPNPTPPGGWLVQVDEFGGDFSDPVIDTGFGGESSSETFLAFLPGQYYARIAIAGDEVGERASAWVMSNTVTVS